MNSTLPKFLFLICSLIAATHGYKTIYIEDNCLFGDENVVYRLEEEGYYSSVKLMATRYSNYGFGKNCNITINPKSSGSGVVISVREIDFPYSSPLDGCADYVKIYNGFEDNGPPLCGFLLDYEERRYFSSDKSLRFLYHTSSTRFPRYKGIGFEFTVTSHRPAPCSYNEFKCQNSRCIWEGLKCDGRNNCGDNSDETISACEDDIYAGHLNRDILLIACGVVVCILLLFTFSMICIRRRRTLSHRELPRIGTDPSELAHISSPYDAIYPAEFGVSRNPGGSQNPDMHGFANPCYPYGIPPPPAYKP